MHMKDGESKGMELGENIRKPDFDFLIYRRIKDVVENSGEGRGQELWAGCPVINIIEDNIRSLRTLTLVFNQLYTEGQVPNQ